MRTIAIGDIHGCSQALLGLIQALKPQQEDLLIFLGDYVDRGPDSRGVIDMLIALQEQCRTVFLTGNHEIMFEAALNGVRPDLWLQSGGRQTVTSYGGSLDNVSVRHREFLANCVQYYETEDHLFVHANYRAELPLTEQPVEALFWDHLSDHVPGPHSSGKHVFLGHSPQPEGEIGYYGHFTCLDTACFAGHWLSAIDVESLESWQVSRHGQIRENWPIIKKFVRFCRRVSGP